MRSFACLAAVMVAATVVVSAAEPLVLQGELPNDGFGDAIAAAGDVNGDGFGDLIVGAPGHHGAAGLISGKAYLYFGSADGLVPAPAWTTEGEAFDQRGSAVAGAGDVDGDGFADVVVGAPGFFAHEALLFSGSPTGPEQEPSWSFTGGHPSQRFGAAASPAGDMNGDGFADFAVGSQFLQQVLVFAGAPGGPAAGPAWTLDGGPIRIPWYPPFFGMILAPGGDFDGNGFGDLLVGAPLHTDQTVAAGRVFGYGGSPDGPSSVDPWFSEGEQLEEERGWAVASGDVDGDGFSDALVGSPWYDDYPSCCDHGRALLYRGSPQGLRSDQAWTSVGDRNTGYGRRIAMGDFNGDGFDDVVVPVRDGFDLFPGSPAGLRTEPLDWQALGTLDVPGFWQLQAVGDLNGDGADELAGRVVVTLPNSPGVVVVIYGSR